MHDLHPIATVLRAAAALSLAGLCGCETDFSGTYTGDAVESGKVSLAVPGSTARADNESPRRKLEGRTLVVSTQSDGVIRATFDDCALLGKRTSGQTALLKATCEVKVAGFEGPLPLSGMLTVEPSGIRLEVNGAADNSTTNVSYTYSFTGKK